LGSPYAGSAYGAFDAFSTVHSNGTNKVLDTPCTFLLFSPVYIESHPRRNTAPAASCTSSISSNSFASYPFRTHASHLKATVSSNSFAINRFRTLCKIPGIGYPPPSIFLDRHSVRSPRFPAVHPFSLQSLTKCSSRNSFLLITIHFHGGCIPPSLFSTLAGAQSARTALASIQRPSRPGRDSRPSSGARRGEQAAPRRLVGPFTSFRVNLH
jgi:hypothetical protein